jgi:ADP-ribose pyrophosphatase YjhB (NUDIX family)
VTKHHLSGFYGSVWKRPASVAVIVRTVGGSVLLAPDAAGDLALPSGMVKTGEDPRGAATRVLDATSLQLPLGRILAIDYQQTPDSPAEAISFIYDGGTYDGGDLAAAAGAQAGFLDFHLALLELGPTQAAQLKAAMDAHELLTVLELRDGRRLDTVQREVPRRELIAGFDGTPNPGR